MDSLVQQLEDLLSEPLPAVLRRERTSFDELTSPYTDSLVLFGAGNLGRRVLTGLRTVGVEPLAFADNNPALWGSCVAGLPVLSVPQAAEQFGDKAAFVVTTSSAEATERMSERIALLRQLGCTRVVPFVFLYWKYPETFLPYYFYDLPHLVIEQSADVVAAAGLWSDEASRRYYLSHLRFRLLGDFDALPTCDPDDAYVPPDLVSLGPSEILVDCGAFDGDTIRQILDRRCSFARIHAMEPDPISYVRLQDYLHTLPEDIRTNITPYPLAVGERRGQVRFAASGTVTSSVGEGDCEVEIVPLDEIQMDAPLHTSRWISKVPNWTHSKERAN
ncbi:MAG: hypothetical protein WCP21_09405 [Armatimonadota bacterium]